MPPNTPKQNTPNVPMPAPLPTYTNVPTPTPPTSAPLPPPQVHPYFPSRGK